MILIKVLGAVMVLATASVAAAGELTVEITGVSADRGAVYVALYDHPEGFPLSGKQRVGQVVAATSSHVTAVFRDLPPGDYAAAAFQDFNGDGQLDRNALGIPKEPYGFSNGARGHAGPPRFAKAAVRLESTATMTVILK